MSWSIFLFVFSLKINETIHSIRIKQWVQQKQNITHRYGSTHIFRRRFYDTHYHVSITHRYGSTKEQMHDILPDGKEPFVSITLRYGSTTVFTAFHVFIIPYFYCFSIFFSKKVGQPLHSKFPQSLDFTGFFIFVKNSSEVHRLFYRIFNNLLFECPTLNFYRKPKI